MAAQTPFKDLIDHAATEALARGIQHTYPSFPSDRFIQAVVPALPALELKDRVRHVALALRGCLPERFPAAARVLVRAADHPDVDGMIAWSLCQYIEDNGLEHFEESMAALHRLTSLWSAEFAIRPFLLQQPERTLQRLGVWTEDRNHHVRRLVSEGTRTRLPWGQRLPHFIQDPDPVFELLERLRLDPELYVRRSVANNLNDLSKDHPERVVQVTQDWMAEGGPDQAWMARHALRTLVKKGHAGALEALGFGPPLVVLESLSASASVQLGEAMDLVIELRSTGSADQKLVIDYAVHHVKKNGKRTPKVFKWSTRRLAPGAHVHLSRRHAFKPISTRKYYAGQHAVEVLVNGQSLGMVDFELHIP